MWCCWRSAISCGLPASCQLLMLRCVRRPAAAPGNNEASSAASVVCCSNVGLGTAPFQQLVLTWVGPCAAGSSTVSRVPDTASSYASVLQHVSVGDVATAGMCPWGSSWTVVTSALPDSACWAQQIMALVPPCSPCCHVDMVMYIEFLAVQSLPKSIQAPMPCVHARGPPVLLAGCLPSPGQP